MPKARVLHGAVGGPVGHVEDAKGEGEEHARELVDVDGHVLSRAPVHYVLGLADAVGKNIYSLSLLLEGF